MPRYAQGSPVRLSTEVRDAAGVAAAPGSILLRVKRPDGTFLPDYTAPVEDSQGKYHQDLPAADLTQLGQYAYAWITTGAAAGVSPPASFQVVDPFAPSHVSFGDVRARLNLPASTLGDDELQDMIASAVAEQEHWVGAVAPRQVTETVTAASGRLELSTRPVLSVVSAALAGTLPVSVTGWAPTAAGCVTAPVYLSGAYTVTYLAGRNPVPPDLVEAALKRVQFMYDPQRGGSGGYRVGGVDIGGGADDGGTARFLMLRDAERLEAPYRMPVVA
jgi:hypothetical protein